ncbi:hypothetical protein, partial [Paenibacillus sp. 32O-W]|uniref:hypothetical protein n=1 Tax=Paenibacillus sp. 32O-W TaxID=1695218 RepID=UPI001C92FB16
MQICPSFRRFAEYPQKDLHFCSTLGGRAGKARRESPKDHLHFQFMYPPDMVRDFEAMDIRRPHVHPI